MKHQIFVNLKRFDVPRQAGGICPVDDPTQWIETIIADTVALGLGQHAHVQLTYLLPEGLLPTAIKQLQQYKPSETQQIAIGCQGVHWDDIAVGGNFGAFTSVIPASAARNMGCAWAMIGHSEERRFKLQVMNAFDDRVVART